MSYRTFSILLVCALSTVFSTACGDDDMAAAAPECEAIIERCHALDTGSGPAHDCHAYAETAGRTAAECTAMQASCFATCTAPTDGGTGADAGVHDHDAGGGDADAGGSAIDAGAPDAG